MDLSALASEDGSAHVGIAILVTAGVTAAVSLVHGIVYGVFGHAARLKGTVVRKSLAYHSRGPTRWLAVSAAMWLTLSAAGAQEWQPGGEVALQVLSIGMIVSVGWFAAKMTSVFDDYMRSVFRMEEKDNLRARKVHTQVMIVKRVVITVICVVTFAAVLMTFREARQLGTSLLASAGIAGVVLGFAAQRSIGTLVAGVQVAITQPIRIDDAVIVEGEWGWIEEITLTYVVIKVWDLRRLVVPITFFLEKPFQNWTRVTADLLGTVFIYADYTVPVDAVRQELHKVLQTSGLWDGKVWGLQVTNAGEKTVELRALMSAGDSSRAWDLRCLVREKLVEFLQKQYPDSLPRVRGEIGGPNKDGSDAGG